jgi:hypothetical protein
MKFVGIDNGLHGAVVCIFDDKSAATTLSFHDTPTLSVKRSDDEYDEAKMREVLLQIKPDYVCLEKSQAMPKQGVVSMHKTGTGYGIWRGLLAGLQIPYEIVGPKTWQKEFFQGRSGDTKTLAYQVASSIFPTYADQLKGPKGGLKDGRCDALLLAEYGRRKIGNK